MSYSKFIIESDESDCETNILNTCVTEKKNINISDKLIAESNNVNIKTDKTKESKKKKQQICLKQFYNEDISIFEIGVDEAGRGPLFGRVYSAAVILPKDNSFDHFKMKDSKKFTSKKKIEEVAKYIKENALAWYVSFEDEKVIDEINILQATQRAMHNAIIETKKQLDNKFKNMNSSNDEKYNSILINNANNYSFQLLIDGNYFNPICNYNKLTNKIETIPHVTIESGDNKYSSIAAASILAKVYRDNYIEELCENNPDLIEKYGIDSNKGYGSKKHLDGIREHGITIWHRRTFGICKNYI